MLPMRPNPCGYQRCHPRPSLEPVCAAPGTVCRNKPARLMIDGQNVASQFCRYHACFKVDGGRTCPIAKFPRESFCREHMRCTAVESGMRCYMNVSGGGSTAYNFCTELHLCTFPGCENARVRQDGQDLQFCHDHRCDHGSCRNVKEAGPFCKSHTCEELHCVSFVPGGDFGDPERFCERHRRCLKAYCSRFCHVRENGLPSPFCGAHYCEFSDCSNERDAAAHCPDHTCGEPGCIKGRESVTGLYCKDHGCKTKGCRMKKHGKDYCPYHRCVADGCEGEVDENRYCERHKKRPEGEPERERGRLKQALGGPIFATCEDDFCGHCPGFGDRMGCGRAVERGTRYCEYHICEIRECRDPRAPSFEYCGNHRCIVSGCHRTRRLAIPSCRRSGENSTDGLFCDNHACSQAGCRNRSFEDAGWCFEHVRCRVDGYRLEPDAAGDGAGCWGRRRRSTGWGGPQLLRERDCDRRGDFERRGDYERRRNCERRGDYERRNGWGENREGRNPWEAWGLAM